MTAASHPALAVFVFLFAVYGLATALAVLKIGQFLFGRSHCPDKNCRAARHPLDQRKFLGRVPGLGDLFYCPPCLAFWLGTALSVYALSPASLVVPARLAAAVLDGLMACGVVWLLHLAAERLGHGLDL